MSTDRFFAILPFLVVVCFIATITARAIYLNQRRVRVFVPNDVRSPADRVQKIASNVIFWSWIGFVAYYAWNPNPAWLPASLNYKLINAPAARWLGAVLIIGGFAIYPVALANMGYSWRVGIDREAHTPDSNSRRPPATLITHGLFRFSRNPIYVMVDGLFFCTFLIHGRVIFLFYFIAFAALLHVQILHEEQFLAERYGDTFADYRRRVGRYLPYRWPR